MAHKEPNPERGRKTSRVLFTSYHVERVTAKNLKPIVKEMVAEDAHGMTDTSTVLESAVGNRKQDQVNHSAGEYFRRENGVCITANSGEGYFAVLKRGNYGVYHHWSRKYFGQYLREFDWRYTVRKLPDAQRAVIALKMTGGKRLLLRPPQDQP